MSDSLEMDVSSQMRLAEWENTKDHGIQRCPDGSFLHVYSINVTNDGARAARYGLDWDILAQGEVETNAPERAHNDMPVICSEHLQGVAFTNHSDFKATFFEIGPDATVTDTHTIDTNAHISGAAFVYDKDSDRFLMIANGDHTDPGLQAIWINRDLSIDDRVRFSPIPSLSRHFWPQALMRVGDHWLLAFLGVTTPGQYLSDDGDVYVAVLDNDFNTLETIKVSDNTDGSGMGSARPSFARYTDQLLVAWDKGFLPYVAVITLDLVALGLDEDDSGFVAPSSAEDAEDGAPCDSGGQDTNASDRCVKGCGCATKGLAPQTGWALLLGLVGLARRRR
jgi:MYXO-CTERM domain-containing protein